MVIGHLRENWQVMAPSDVCPQALLLGPRRPQWSVIVAAPTTSQVIGVLAAIIFTVVILLLQQDHVSDAARHRYSVRALNTLLLVFFMLVLASFFFSVISGEQLCGRAFAEGAFAGAFFALGGTLTFLSLCWLFAAHRIGGEQVLLVKVLMSSTVLTAWTFNLVNLLDAVEAIEQPNSYQVTGVVWWGVMPLVAPVGAGVLTTYWPAVRRWLSRRAAGLFVWTTTASVIGAVLAIAGFAWTTVQDGPIQSFPLALRFAVMGTLAVLDAFYLANMAVIERVAPSPTTAGSLDYQPQPQSGARSPSSPPAIHAPDDGNSAPVLRVTLEIGCRRAR